MNNLRLKCIELHKSGLSNAEIAKTLSCTTSNVRHHLSKSGISTKKRLKLDKQKFISLLAGGMSFSEIARTCDLDVSNVSAYAKKFGIQPTHGQTVKIVDDDIIKLYQNSSIADLTAKLSMAPTAIVNRLRENSIEIREQTSELINTLLNDKYYTNSELDIDDFNLIVSMYESNNTQDQISNAVGCSRQRVGRIIKYLGIGRTKAEIAALNPKVSSIQILLYSILDDLGIKYYKERIDSESDKEVSIGPYNFDCVIPRENKPTLLIECQGDYWHNTDTHIRNDKAKSTYIERYYSNQYELKYIWEHEFLNKDKIIDLIKYWTGINTEVVDFNFNEIEVKRCEASDYRLLLSKYHYLPNAGRGGIAYGAYLGNELVAVCVFSPLGRQNINESVGYEIDEVRELSRLCINPKFQKKNFASWLIGRSISKLDRKYKCIISYADTTFNHDGTIYRASNFMQDRIVPPDYWYVAKDGWAMHKRTMYGHAVDLNMKEAEFAELHGYKRVYGSEKLRFVYDRLRLSSKGKTLDANPEMGIETA